MSDKLTVNFREVVRHGDDPRRQASALERATAAAFKVVQDWINRYAPAVALCCACSPLHREAW